MSKRIVSRDLPAGVRSHSANTSNKRGRKRGRIVSAIEVLEVRRLLSTFVVTTNLDTPVPLPGSLREAIILADTNPGPDTITVNIPGPSTTIAPSIPLPDVTDSTTIDATTQPGYSGKPVVVIDGTATPPGPTLPPMPDVAPGADDGLRFTGGSSTVEGLAITGFQKLNAAGIRLLNSSVVSVTSNSSVQFNLIGLAADGSTALGNSLDGIFIDGSNNQIGTPTTGNSIAYNGHNGITVGTSAADVAAIQNAIRGNNIYLNGGLGIDLGDDGVTMNDPGDADIGPNMLQNFPVLTKVTLSGNTATITGTLNSTPSSTFALDFFASQIWDTTHYGEGQKYLGSISVTTDASGNASFTATMPGVPSGFNYFAATATDSNGNTSEFCYDPEAATTPGQAPGVKRGLVRLERRMKKSLFGEIEIRRRG